MGLRLSAWVPDEDVRVRAMKAVNRLQAEWIAQAEPPIPADKYEQTVLERARSRRMGK